MLSDQGSELWLDRLDKDDPIIRRLEMICLFRSGTPAEVVASQYNAVEEYIYRINEKFSHNGLLGLITEDDMERLFFLTRKCYESAPTISMALTTMKNPGSEK